MTGLFHVDQATADRWRADGRFVLFGEGELARNAAHCKACGKTIESAHRHDYRVCGCPNGTMVDGGLAYRRWGAVDIKLVEDRCEYRPPAAMIEAAKPCEQMFCVDGRLPAIGDPSGATIPCPDCSNGQRRHPVTVPCDGLGGEHRQGPCPNDGRISTGLLAVVEFGPLVVQLRPNNVTDADLPGLFISNEGQAVLVLADGRPHHVTLPPDVDPASLVGLWAIGGRIEVAG